MGSMVPGMRDLLRGRRFRFALLAAAIGLASPTAVQPVAAAEVKVRFERIDGFEAPGTPAELNKVGVIQVGRKSRKHILILNPGTSASAAYFVPLAKTVVQKARSWQIWAVERRENLLEDHSVLDRAKAGQVSGQELFDYYLGFLTNPSVTTHFQFIDDADVAFARDWGMRTEIEDLRRVVQLAAQRANRIVVRGHALGGPLTT